jgi:nitroimidazol reductase NimA-like FMN-containing flavoprotein (pyridoxamine 5'-phosphate oxidase superfamily)
MENAEIDKLINEQILCRIAFGGKNAPYIAPFQYVSVDGQLYFHFTNYGRKMGFLKEGNAVCVEIEKYTQDLSAYSFLALIGKLKLVTDPQERARAIEKMVSASKQKQLSSNFLVAHGFSKEADWSSLTVAKHLVIVKLESVTEKTGLKSP